MSGAMSAVLMMTVLKLSLVVVYYYNSGVPGPMYLFHTSMYQSSSFMPPRWQNQHMHVQWGDGSLCVQACPHEEEIDAYADKILEFKNWWEGTGTPSCSLKVSPHGPRNVLP